MESAIDKDGVLPEFALEAPTSVLDFADGHLMGVILGRLFWRVFRHRHDGG
jgi:hypothetical protein